MEMFHIFIEGSNDPNDQISMKIKEKKKGYHIVVQKYGGKMEESQSDVLSDFTLQLPS